MGWTIPKVKHTPAAAAIPLVPLGLNPTSITCAPFPPWCSDKKQTLQSSFHIFSHFFFKSSAHFLVSVCVCVCVPLMHTHAHTILLLQLSKPSISHGLRLKLWAVQMDTFATSPLQFVWQLWKMQPVRSANTLYQSLPFNWQSMKWRPRPSGELSVYRRRKTTAVLKRSGK